MKTSSERILTTHVGSLPRSARVADLLFAAERCEPVDAVEFDAVMAEAVEKTVRRQVAAGIDIVSDGETAKISYATYVKDRVTGFDGDSPRRPPADLEDYPSFLERQAKRGGTPTYRRPKCVGEVRPKTLQPLHDDLRRFRAALDRHRALEGFMNAASPGVIALFQPNEYYPTQDAYLEALAEAMRPEYEAIAGAGLILQLDSPDLGLGRHMMYKDHSEAEYLRLAGAHVEVLNHALRNVPAPQVRMHICWGNYEGPHTHDIALAALLPVVLRAKPQGLLFEASNPRHAHEVATVAELKALIPEDRILIPGVLDSTTNFVEHPELVAQRVLAFADIVGRERVIAGTDCGFSTFAGFGAVDAEIVWAKLASMAEGAARASARLWRDAA